MPPQEAEKKSNDTATHRTSAGSRSFKDAFSIPWPIKALFDKVPLLTYPPNELPKRGKRQAGLPSLYVFATESQAAKGRPSFNPSCLKWQTFLKITGIDYRLVSSNNHASPTGVLPFLLPALADQKPSSELIHPIPSSRLIKYVTEQGTKLPEMNGMRYEAYQSLLDTRIRSAWLYTMYLEKANFNEVAYRLYVAPTSSNSFVRATISYQLQAAAEAELLNHSAVIDIEGVYSEAAKALEALSIWLGEDPWFFGNEEPSLFDASVFAYTHLLLDDDMGWREKRLCLALRKRTNLVQHRERLLVRYYGG